MPEEKSLPTVYDPKVVEDKWYQYWIEGDYFKPEIDPEQEPFTIVIPPPNVTGALHMGHALDNTIQDVLIRWKRMTGVPTLWLPGTDHAGIATQAKVVASLAEEGLTPHDVGREKFLERTWQWKEQYGGRIIEQLKRLGASCDWSRERFTMDEGCSRAVREVFVSLFEKGLIYRGDYIINWCPRCGTAVSDIEVEHEETEGKLWHFRYPLVEGDGYVTVATTRPETILGDTAVAVHPNDERYRDLVGKSLILPGVGRHIPIVADPYVDPEFGTGAVKVTPAHDPNDFQIGLRHGLEQVVVIAPDGTMNEKAGKYQGMDRLACREALVADFAREGYLVKVEEHHHAVGHCSRCNTTIEPLLSKQWFVKMKPLAEPALAAVRKGQIRFVPERFTKIYCDWLENIRDWCISRQLWWGHRIPVWYCQGCGEVIASRVDLDHCPHCGGKVEQDPDVLDTWFSSALWPFSTLGWPDQTEDLGYFYPTSVLVTGRDIIFFWVARMIFMGLAFMQEEPFREVLIHGLVLDSQGRKMSKSLGNGIDPLEVIEEYGADTLRFMLITSITPGNDMRFYWERVENCRNFANKIWNASRFALLNLAGFQPEGIDENRLAYSMADRWILSRLNRTIARVTEELEQYQLGEAATILYEFIWGELCDWYIEMIKPRLYGKEDEEGRRASRYVLWKVLENTLRLLHPFMPFITEEIWQHLPHSGPSICVAPWPEAGDTDPVVEEEMERIMAVIRGVRNIRAEMSIAPGKKAPVVIQAPAPLQPQLESGIPYLIQLAGAGTVSIQMAGTEKPRQAAAAIVGGVEVYVPLEGLIDIDKEIARLRKEQQALEKEVQRAATKLQNENFLAKAPAQVVAKEREKEQEYRDKLIKVKERVALLEG
ncbi:MAG TPA: valine--tRNA ligase [Firmicutes bacterium]|nr:valine--tRNA ligase [Bacillota bacterium]